MLKKLNLILTICVFIVFIFSVSPLLQSNAENAQPTLKIDTLPRDIFIAIDKLKPGDTVTSKIKVINKGNLDFDYNILSEYTGGSSEFFQALLLNVSDEKGNLLYEGRLSELNKLDKSRKLLMFSSEILSFRIHVPHELGNEFQGLNTTSKITFAAHENFENGSNSDQNAPPKGETLPMTATNSFNLLIIGLILSLIGISIYLVYKRKNREEF
jgi:LPXTG-motif cell wall-anchored protein